MRTLLAALATLVAFVLTAGAQAQQQAGPQQVETYINSIRTLQARFVQSNPNGSNVQGTLYVSRPGKMRFQYDPPSQLKIVADGRQVTMWDPANKDFGQWPIGWTAASFLVQEPFKLSGDITVVANQRTPDGLLALTLVQTRKPQEGKVIVRLSENPMQLRGWTVIDNRGNKVDVSLTNVQTGIQLANSLFKYDGPDAGQILGGGQRN
jgi:outer membrane lipoprotein-sorting protein